MNNCGNMVALLIKVASYKFYSFFFVLHSEKKKKKKKKCVMEMLASLDLYIQIWRYANKKNRYF